MPVSTTPQGGIGITLGVKASGATAFTPLAELMDDCELSGISTTVIPLPTLATVTLTKTPGRIDSGDFTGSVYLVLGDTGTLSLVTMAQARTAATWQVQLPDGSSATSGSTMTFNGFISSLKPGNFTGEDAPHLDLTIAISGPVSFAAGT